MIADKLENCSLYFSVNSRFEKAFEFIGNYIQKELPDGRYDIDGDLVYAFVQSYETVSAQEMKWETHKKYIDLQFIVKGKEIIEWTPINDLMPSGEYSEEKDCTLYEDGEGSPIKLKDGYFSILYPEDAHKPKCMWGKAESIRKIVVKIKL